MATRSQTFTVGWTLRSFIKAFVFVLLLSPVAALAWTVLTNRAGPNPVEFLEHGTGDWAIILLMVTLAITPLRTLTNWQRLLQYRRMLGLFAFFYGVVHFGIYLSLDQGLAWSLILADLYKRPFIIAGFTALMLMVPLAVTSTKGMIRRLGGKRWQLLHRLIYLSAVAAVVHYWWLVKSDIRKPLLYAAILFLLMTFRWRLVAALFAAALPAFSQQPENLDLVLLIGQSNMAGRGVVEAEDRVPIPGVYALKKDDSWAPAVDPLHWDKPEIAGVGLGRSFAKTVGGRIGLIPAAFGGTSLDQWKPGSPLFNEAVRRAKVAMKSGRLRAILWHQGEADANKRELAESYASRWTEMMSALRKELNAADAVVVVGELGYFLEPEKYPYATEINRQLHLLGVKVASAEGLHDKGDRLHFDAAGQREFGRRYAQAYLTSRAVK